MKGPRAGKIVDFFRVTVSQQRGIAVLVGVLLVFVAGVAVKQSGDAARLAREEARLLESQGAALGDTLFYFDPSTADSATFVRLGFTPAQARTIVRYRTSCGGRFSSPEHFSRSYAVSPDMYVRLAPYIRMESSRPTKPRPEDFSRVDVNRASLERLKAHATLDDRLAQRIFEARIRYGGFVDRKQLESILPGDSLAVRVFAGYADFDTAALVRYQVNRDSESLLAQHPYIARPFARQILAYRAQHGCVPCYDTLRTLKYFPRTKDRYLRFYLTFDTLKNRSFIP